MKLSNYFSEYFETINEKLFSIESKTLEQAAEMIWNTHESGKKIIVVGNGGSAAMSSHVCVDLTKAASIRAINFNEADLLTCFANDYGYEHWVSKALEAYSDPSDLVILISSSGESKNIINAAITAKKLKLSIITVSGFSSDNLIRKLGDLNLWLDSSEYNIVEMTHHVWLVSIIDYLIKKKEIKQ